MAGTKETVLYYSPNKDKKSARVKSVLIQMGIRIKNISPQQIHQSVGYLAGLEGFSQENPTEAKEVIPQEVLVLKDFSSARLNQMLYLLRKAQIPKIELKAVITPHNASWSFYQLYQEIKSEHEAIEKSQDTVHKEE